MTPLLSLILIAAPVPESACPLQSPAAAELRCSAETGPNWTFAFAWPVAAPRLPGLEREMEARRAQARADAETIPAYAAGHPDGRFHYEQAFALDANRPELIALSATTDSYSGGAHGWYAFDTLLWDPAADRRLGLYELFSDAPAGRAELERQLCPALLEVRRARVSFRGGCDGAPEDAALVASGDGQIDTLRVRYAELDGYAGGGYEVFLPVTPAFIAALDERFRPAFRGSSAPALGCNTSVPDPACDARQRQ